MINSSINNQIVTLTLNYDQPAQPFDYQNSDQSSAPVSNLDYQGNLGNNLAQGFQLMGQVAGLMSGMNQYSPAFNLGMQVLGGLAQNALDQQNEQQSFDYNGQYGDNSNSGNPISNFLQNILGGDNSQNSCDQSDNQQSDTDQIAQLFQALDKMQNRGCANNHNSSHTNQNSQKLNQLNQTVSALKSALANGTIRQSQIGNAEMLMGELTNEANSLNSHQDKNHHHEHGLSKGLSLALFATSNGGKY